MTTPALSAQPSPTPTAVPLSVGFGSLRYRLGTPRFVSGSPLFPALVDLLTEGLPEEDPHALINLVEHRVAGRFLLLVDRFDSTRLAAAALLRRRSSGVLHLLALVVAPELRSLGLGAGLVSTAARLTRTGLDIDIAAPDPVDVARLCADPALRLPDPDARRFAFYLRLGAQLIVDSSDIDDGTLTLWLPPAH